MILARSGPLLLCQRAPPCLYRGKNCLGAICRKRAPMWLVDFARLCSIIVQAINVAQVLYMASVHCPICLTDYPVADFRFFPCGKFPITLAFHGHVYFLTPERWQVMVSVQVASIKYLSMVVIAHIVAQDFFVKMPMPSFWKSFGQIRESPSSHP